MSSFSVSDANVRKHLQRVEEKLSQDLQREKAMYRGMFSSSMKSGSEEEINQTHRGGEGVLAEQLNAPNEASNWDSDPPQLITNQLKSVSTS